MRPSPWFGRLLALALSAPSALALADEPKPPDVDALKKRVDRVESNLSVAEDRLSFLEREYVQKQDLTEEQQIAQTFAKGAAQFGDGDYQSASIQFYDILGKPLFKDSANYDDAVYYLAESLYRLDNELGARHYFRELLELKRSHFRPALVRYLELSSRFNQYDGIEMYVEKARAADGSLPPEVAYVYGKWLLQRRDLSLADRVRRASSQLQPVADGESEYRLQAAYLLSVMSIQQGNYDEAQESLAKLIKRTPRDDRERSVNETAELARARIFYEQGKLNEAIESYQEIPRDSDNFVPALYEIAWVWVKKGEFDKALKATDLMLLISPDSPQAPESRILQGHLFLKLAQYSDASGTYKEVINQYAPVRDEIDALLKLHDDPVAYFDDLLARGQKDFDVTSLLPEAAAKWATTQKEVEEALRMTNDLGASTRGVGESNEVARRLLASLNERGLNAFPVLQEGYSNAESVDSSLTAGSQEILEVQTALLAGKLGDVERELSALRTERASLEERFRNLPKTEQQVADRRARFQARLKSLDDAAFELQVQSDGLLASLAAVDKWVVDSRASRPSDPEGEAQFLAMVADTRKTTQELAQAIADIRRTAKEEQLRSGNVSADESVRIAYQASLDREQALLSRASSQLGGDARDLAGRLSGVNRRIEGNRQRASADKVALQRAASSKAESIRRQVEEEQANLRAYEAEITKVSGEARNLVGRIAFDSFKRIHRQFYDLVLKADIGMIDVAWTKKQDDTNKIQKLSRDKDRQLRSLDDEFKDVLKDVE